VTFLRRAIRVLVEGAGSALKNVTISEGGKASRRKLKKGGRSHYQFKGKRIGRELSVGAWTQGGVPSSKSGRGLEQERSHERKNPISKTRYELGGGGNSLVLPWRGEHKRT